MKRVSIQSQERFLMLAGALGLAGLATAMIYVLHSTPYTMVLFMAGGISLIAVAALMFAFVIARDIRSRLASMTEGELAAGDVICEQGEAAEFLYVITEGEVELTAKEQGKDAIQIGRLGASEFFGDMAILSGTPYQATAKAFTDVKLWAIHRRDFKSMHAHLPSLRDRVHAEQERKVAILKEKLDQG